MVFKPVNNWLKAEIIYPRRSKTNKGTYKALLLSSKGK
jgi:hypothetical protein